MIFRSKRMHLLLPLLALSVAVSTASPAQASGPDVSLQINFGSRPHWEGVRGTNVQVIRQSDRSDYDMFHYGRFYYAYNNENGRWYMSRRYNGRFALIDDRSVPRQLRRIPRNHWRNYPTAWEDRGYEGSRGTSGTFQVSFGSAPHWSGISGTRVEVIPYSERPNYDVFRYGGSYYAYSDNRWYTSTRESGQFTFVEDRAVPSELSTVPREHWRNYPPAWGRNGGNPGSNGNGPGNSKEKGRQNNGRGHSG